MIKALRFSQSFNTSQFLFLDKWLGLFWSKINRQNFSQIIFINYYRYENFPHEAIEDKWYEDY